MNIRLAWAATAAALLVLGASRGLAAGYVPFPRLDHSVEMRAKVSGFGARDSTVHAVAGKSSSYVRVSMDVVEPKEFSGRTLMVWSEYPTRVRKHKVQSGDVLVFTWLAGQDPDAMIFEKLPNLRVGN